MNLNHLVLVALLENLVLFLEISVEMVMLCITLSICTEMDGLEKLRFGDLNREGMAVFHILSHFAVV